MHGEDHTRGFCLYMVWFWVSLYKHKVVGPKDQCQRARKTAITCGVVCANR